MIFTVMNKIDKQKVLEFQAKIVDKILDADRECFRLLRKQFEQITVADMEGDSAGFYMYYSHKNVDPKYQLYNIEYMIWDVGIGYRRAFDIGDLIFYIIGGYIDCLECAWLSMEDIFDADWPPKDYEGFYFYYCTKDPKYIEYTSPGGRNTYSMEHRDYSISVNKFTCRYLSSQADDYKLRLEKYACKYKLQ